MRIKTIKIFYKYIKPQILYITKFCLCQLFSRVNIYYYFYIILLTKRIVV